MDFVGTVMGIATIPMALLSLLSVLGAALLLGSGHVELVALGLLAIFVGLGVAVATETLSRQLDAATWQVLSRHGRGDARPIAAIAGTMPVLIALVWEAACFVVYARAHLSGGAAWLWGYGVAMWPWTIFALATHGDRRTLCGIRAYAGHIAYWLLSLAVLVLKVPFAAGVTAMLLPAALPITVGILLAAADRDALRNVRI